MNYENYFKDLLESIPDYKTKVLIMFLIKKGCCFTSRTWF